MDEKEQLIADLTKVKDVISESEKRIDTLELKRTNLRERIAALEANESLNE